jgi:hypothetical protein
MSDGQSTSIPALEADIAARRERLARTIDELAGRVTPQALLQQQKRQARARFVAATTTPEGDLRTERIAAIVLAGVALIGAWIMLGRRGRRSGR